MSLGYHEVIDMNSVSQHLNSTVLIDRETLKNMMFNDMVGRVEQMRATGRYRDIHLNCELGAVVAEWIA